MSIGNIAIRTAALESLIPLPPGDVAPMRTAFAGMVSKQWQTFVPDVLAGSAQGLRDSQLAKVRFIGEMYARACYSMLLVSAKGPAMLRLPIRAAAVLPQSRHMTIWLGGKLLAALEKLHSRAVHRQVLLTSALMGTLDVVLDEAAFSGEGAVLRVASLITQDAPASLLPAEQPVAALAKAARRDESAWQSDYWEKVLEPAVRNYCLAEVLAVTHASDPSGMGHRWAGIDAAIKGMWYAAGPCMDLRGSLSLFDQGQWNCEQRWMADASLLMQMIDDWVDQDEDRGARLTPITTGDWSLQSVSDLYSKTIRDLGAMLIQSGIRSPVLQELFADLYRDYLHTAIEAMRNGVAN
jgi:hypothetical protein